MCFPALFIEQINLRFWLDFKEFQQKDQPRLHFHNHSHIFQSQFEGLSYLPDLGDLRSRNDGFRNAVL